MNKNPNSHLTAKERDKESWPTRWMFRKGLLSGEVLDFGSGDGTDAQYLRGKNLDCTEYDPHYAPDYPAKRFDTIICNYVLNVLLPEEQADVLMSVSELLKPTGRAYFTVRRDLKYFGYRTHKVHKVKTYQCNVVLPYRSVLENDFCEIYEYRHYNQIDHGRDGVFINPSPDTELITELATAYSIYDAYPVSEGHALVIPKRPTPNYFETSEREQTAIWMMVRRVKHILDQRYAPDGYNIGFNVNEAAGQTIFHTHIHVIPRYKGDVENPRGGVRNVIPGMGVY